MADDKKTKGDTKADSSSEPKSDTKVENNSEPKGDAKVEKSSEPKKAAAKIGIVAWAIVAVSVVLCAGSGFFLGRLFAGSDKPKAQPPQADQSASSDSEATAKDAPAAEGTPAAEGAPAAEGEEWWYYDLEPVVANLDEPGVTRYVRATITLEISSALEKAKSEKLLEQKKPILKNWLTIYLASLTLEDTRGDRNLKRIQLQILDAFNERLFPDAKPQIKQILFKEFAVQ